MSAHEHIVTRADGWINALTGLGTWRDRTTATTFEGGVFLTDLELTDLFNFSAMARKIVTLVPSEMMREGYELKVPGGDPTRLLEWATRVRLDAKVKRAMVWGALYGGGALLLGVADGRKQTEPMGRGRIVSVDVLDKRYLTPWIDYGEGPKLGEPKVYALRGEYGTAYVHESRLLIFGGAETDEETREQLGGWDASVLQACYDALAHFDEVNRSARVMMSDANQGVFKMKGLIDSLASSLSNLVQTRLALLDMGRSVARAVVLDANGQESFEKVPSNFGGVGDVLTHAANLLAAASEIPVTLLMGQAPAGLNATGASDVRIFYDRVRARQRDELVPALELLYRLASGVTVTVEPLPLYQEDPKTQAETRKIVAETDAIYLDHGVVTEDEVATSRFRAEGWNPETTVDLALRARMAQAAASPAEGEGELVLAPTDLATIVTVNEARASIGLAPLPGPDGELTLTEYKAKHGAVLAAAAVAEEGGTHAEDPPGPAPGPVPPPAAV